VAPQRPITHVFELHDGSVWVSDLAAPVDPPGACHSWLQREKHGSRSAVLIQLLGDDWSRTDQRHLASQYIHQLRNLVQARPPQPTAHPRKPGIGLFRQLIVVPYVRGVKNWIRS